MEFEIEEALEPPIINMGDDIRAGGAEKLETNLEIPDVSTEFVHPAHGRGDITDIEGEDYPILESHLSLPTASSFEYE